MTSITIQEWRGHFQFDTEVPPVPHIIKTQAEFLVFQSTIPKHRIQKRQPAPLSSDVLKQHSAFDWSQVQLLVMYSDSIHIRPTIIDIQQAQTQTLITWRCSIDPYAEFMARPMGVGCYLALCISTAHDLKTIKGPDWQEPKPS